MKQLKKFLKNIRKVTLDSSKAEHFHRILCSVALKGFSRIEPYIYDVQMVGVAVLKFITCLRILLLLNNRSLVHFCGRRGLGSQNW